MRGNLIGMQLLSRILLVQLGLDSDKYYHSQVSKLYGLGAPYVAQMCLVQH